MPSYVSHTIMARDVYQRINNNKANMEYMITFSLGGDLCKYSKCRKDSHRIYKDKFISNMYDYIKKNNLCDDKECMGVLYGHICHVVMDNIIHPLVREVVKSCKKNKRNHFMVELYYDHYLLKKIFNKTLNKYDNKQLFKGHMNKKICKMIDYSYEKTYGCKNISRYYKYNIGLYKKIKYLYYLINYKILKKIIGINKFLDDNKEVDLTNRNHNMSFLLDGKKSNLDLDSLYEKSIKEAIKYIKSI